MTVDDQSLTEVLRRHLSHLGREDLASDVGDEVLRADGTRGIVDLMFSRSLTRRRAPEHLVVELKRPSVKIGNGEIEQIQSYAEAVVYDDRFRSLEETRWEFWVVSNEIDPRVQRRVEMQRDREPGLIRDEVDRPFRVWVKTWADVIDECQDRLEFVKRGLEGYAAGADEGLRYLREIHNRYLPVVGDDADAAADAAAGAETVDAPSAT